MVATLVERRKDIQLRGAITNLRESAKSVCDKRSVYKVCLNQFCELTASSVGFIAERRERGLPESSTVLVAVKRPGENSTEPLCAFNLSAVLPLLDEVMLSKRAVCFKARQLQGFNGQVLGWPDVSQVMMFPLIGGDQVMAVVALAGASQGYPPGLGARCQPLCLAATSLLQLFDNRRDAEQLEDSMMPEHPSAVMFEKSSPEPIIRMDSSLRVTAVSLAAERLFGYAQREILGQEFTQFLVGKSKNDLRLMLLGARMGTALTDSLLELTARRADGRSLMIHPVVRYQNCEGERYFELLFALPENINPVQCDSDSFSKHLHAIMDFAPVGIMVVNRQWELLYVNSCWLNLCQRSKTDLFSTGWVDILHQEDVYVFLEQLRLMLVEEQSFQNECRILLPSGKFIWCEFCARTCFDEALPDIGFIASLQDTTERHMSEERLREMAELDVLTGLVNRPLFQDRLEHALERLERRGSFALLCLDLDGFKTVNDTLGHAAGDLLLVEVANRLLESVRREDTVSRTGGDEFMILLEGLSDASVADKIAQSILTALQQPIRLLDQEVFITTSIGITFVVSGLKTNAQTLVKQADVAMYRAKAEGRNNAQYFSPDLEEESRMRLVLGNSLHRALEREEFDVYYQMQACVETGAIMGGEALIRWLHPEQGVLLPSRFLALLEESRLIGPVSNWLWRRAFTDYQSWLDQGLVSPASHISVNLSPLQLRDPALPKYFDAALSLAGLQANRVIVEVTETALLDDSAKSKGLLDALRERGMRLALDDFGTGYSSLTYLKRFDFDVLKVDQSFVRNILTDAGDAAITRGTLALGHSLGLLTVAEGVDCPKKLKLLKLWGCQLYQGYALNEPCSAKAFVELLSPRMIESG